MKWIVLNFILISVTVGVTGENIRGIRYGEDARLVRPFGLLLESPLGTLRLQSGGMRDDVNLIPFPQLQQNDYLLYANNIPFDFSYKRSGELMRPLARDPYSIQNNIDTTAYLRELCGPNNSPGMYSKLLPQRFYLTQKEAIRRRENSPLPFDLLGCDTIQQLVSQLEEKDIPENQLGRSHTQSSLPQNPSEREGKIDPDSPPMQVNLRATQNKEKYQIPNTTTRPQVPDIVRVPSLPELPMRYLKKESTRIHPASLSSLHTDDRDLTRADELELQLGQEWAPRPNAQDISHIYLGNSLYPFIYQESRVLGRRANSSKRLPKEGSQEQLQPRRIYWLSPSPIHAIKKRLSGEIGQQVTSKPNFKVNEPDEVEDEGYNTYLEKEITPKAMDNIRKRFSEYNEQKSSVKSRGKSASAEYLNDFLSLEDLLGERGLRMKHKKMKL